MCARVCGRACVRACVYVCLIYPIGPIGFKLALTGDSVPLPSGMEDIHAHHQAPIEKKGVPGKMY